MLRAQWPPLGGSVHAAVLNREARVSRPLVGRQQGIALDGRDTGEWHREFFGNDLSDRGEHTGAEFHLSGVQRDQPISVDRDKTADLVGGDALLRQPRRFGPGRTAARKRTSPRAHRHASGTRVEKPPYQAWALALLGHLLGGAHHGAQDADVGAAFAQIGRKRLSDLVLGRALCCREEPSRLHDHAVDAVATLSRLFVDECLLQRMRFLQPYRDLPGSRSAAPATAEIGMMQQRNGSPS